MKVIVCGGRNFTDGPSLFAAMDVIHARTPITAVIEGGQRRWLNRVLVGGADYWAGKWALARRIECVTVAADWDDLTHPYARIKTDKFGHRYDAAAGARRNAKMLTKQPDAVIAFKGGPGTLDMMTKAAFARIQIIDIEKGDHRQ